LIGAIAGDMIGSIYERRNIRTTEFPLFRPACRFTDDTVLTVALADSILNDVAYSLLLKDYYRRYPDAGFGGAFIHWAETPGQVPYNSWGNGSAMRVSPVAWAYERLDEVLEQAKRSAEVTHNHPEGIKGAQAIASAVFLARTGHEKAQIRSYVEETFAYDLSETLEALRESYRFDVSCQGSVPQALIAFLASEDFEDAVRKAISIGGDSDTIACMAGAIAHAYYGGVPDSIKEEMYARLDAPLTLIVQEFTARYHCG
jgi:ADP-ribosylglycohydrolase